MFGFRAQKSNVGTLLSEERDILNGALGSVLKSSDDSVNFIKAYLARQYPDLIPEELDVYSRICRSAIKYGHNLLKSSPAADERARMKGMWQASTIAAFPWISDANLTLLLTSDVYHAENDTLAELTSHSIPGYGLTL